MYLVNLFQNCVHKIVQNSQIHSHEDKRVLKCPEDAVCVLNQSKND